MSVTLAVRGARAEMVRTGGRSRLWTVLIPAAVVLPAMITFAIALAAETFARIPGQISVLQVPTSNAAYWVITVTTVVVTVAASDGQACEYRYHTGEYIRLAVPRQWPVLAGRWLFYGTLGAVAAAVALLTVLLFLPLISPQVYGSVSATDPVALRLLWTVPLLSFFAAGAGIGIGALEKLGSEANKPLVVRLDGNKVDEGRKILADANHPLVTLAETMDSGADKAAELASK